ncbi:phosphoribosylglycinamide formyltransferase [Neomegalonema perideroedes]|uniref:phosphoribosylglycinamide formyltransferase n=1 Tax=Neomegalonema perideroedes TaxID=217219 RepID=UPI00037D0DA3|nr:phosphoribosylglycinamide formyltransferase [Neomegalonema perideroedes]
MKRRIGILISGRGSNMEALIRAAAEPEAPFEIALVLANNPEAGGLEKARAAGLRAESVDHRPFKGDREAHERALDAKLREAGAEILAFAGYMRLLTPWFVEAWPDAILNIHPALLPSFKGLHTHERALEAGVLWHGCTVHLVRPAMDEGPILGQAAVPALPGDTAESLGARVLAQEHRLYPEVLRRFASGRLSVQGERVLGEPVVLRADLAES